MERRTFLHSAAGLMLARPKADEAAGLEPYFPSAAHRFVWRNWDLVPAGRIAETLGCSAEVVQRLARSMSLEGEPIAGRYASRARLKAFSRNWDVAPYSQLTRLLGMSRDQIEEFLLKDAFILAYLGPKPEGPEVRIENPASVSAAEIPYFKPAERGPEEPRFGFIERLNRPVGEPPWREQGEPVFKPRITYPYYAVYGDILEEDDFESYYPAGELRNLARIGLSAIWLHVILRDLLKSSIFPEFGRDSEVRLRRLNRLIGQARQNGLGVYLYLNEPRAMPESFFRAHPEIKGAPGRPGDGLYSLCTSTQAVKEYLREASERLFREAPGLEGAFLITASENPTNCYSVTRRTACPRCSRRGGPEVIGEVVRLIEQGARKAKPAAHLIAWDWSWGIVEDDPQKQIIDHLPRTVTLMVDYERGTPITRRGVKGMVDEYCLSVAGPSPRAAAHIRQGRGRGMPVMAKVQVGTTWELGLLPYIPVAPLVARKFESMRSAGISGAMEAWTLGGYPSPNWTVAQAFYRATAPRPEAVLVEAAASLYGARAAPEVAEAWRIFADAFSEYPFSNSLVYSSVVQCGPAHPIYFEPTGKRPRLLNSYDDLGWTQPFGPEVVAEIFESMAAAWRQGLGKLETALSKAPPERKQEARRDVEIARAASLYLQSIPNQVRFHLWRDRAKSDRALLAKLKKLVEQEMELAGRFLSICRSDSRVGFEASLQYFYLPLDVREKIAACRFMLERQFPETEKRIRV